MSYDGERASADFQTAAGLRPPTRELLCPALVLCAR